MCLKLCCERETASQTIMNESAKKATAVTFTLLVLLGVGMAIMFAVNNIVQGNLRVRDDKEGTATLRRLFVEEIVHAGQFLPPSDAKERHTQRDLSRLPVTYWHPQGPVGQVLAKFDWFGGIENTWRADARLPASLIAQGMPHGPLPMGQLAAAWSEPPLGAIPLKAGALAGYARPFQVVDFYEPNPAIYELSFPKAGAPRFTLVRDAQERGAGIRVFQGKERDLLAKQAPRRFYRALFVDAVRGDLKELAEDLLTQEGMAALMAAVAENGVLAIHVSNKNYNLVPIVADVAHALKYHSVLAEDRGERGKGHYNSEWVLVARQQAYLLNRGRASHIQWRTVAPRGQHVWTDAGPHDRTGLERRAN